MIWIILIGIVLFFVAKAVINTGKDENDLAGKTLDEKFNIIVNLINQAAFEGEGLARYIDKKHFNLYPEGGSNQIVEFLYSQGMLSITWKFKYFQKELVFRKNLSNVRNLSLFEQEKIGRAIIDQMENKVQEHKAQVMNF